MSKQTNATHNIAVQAARQMFTVAGYESDCEVRDSLADILHYCESKGLDFENELRIARANHAEESSASR